MRDAQIASDEDIYDLVVIGAGFGGLAAALRGSELGARVLLLEKMRYVGGCAATFHHRGRPYEAGATLSAGLGPGGLFSGWLSRLKDPPQIKELSPVLDFRSSPLTLILNGQKGAMKEALMNRPGVHREGLRRFFAIQEATASILWPILDRPELLLPLGSGALSTHLASSLSYLKLLRWAGRPLSRVLSSCALEGDDGLRLFCDAVSQITLQCGADEVEAPMAMATLDYFERGTRHIDGGLGALANALVRLLRQEGAEVALADGARSLVAKDGLWTVTSRSGRVRARAVCANLLPGAIRRLGGPDFTSRIADKLDHRLSDSWGAAMLYLDLDAAQLPKNLSGHIQLIDDDRGPLTEGRHVFCSLGHRGSENRERDECAATISTHIPMTMFLSLSRDEQASYIDAVHERMRATLRNKAPEIWRAKKREMTASPRTFARFTGRPEGRVGGVPRRAGLGPYFRLRPTEVAPGLYLVGDTVFPGQSTLATALGGIKAAEAALR